MIVLIVTLSVGTFIHPQPSDLACNRAAVEAMPQAARDYPGAVFVSAKCERRAS